MDSAKFIVRFFWPNSKDVRSRTDEDGRRRRRLDWPRPIARVQLNEIQELNECTDEVWEEMPMKRISTWTSMSQGCFGQPCDQGLSRVASWSPFTTLHPLHPSPGDRSASSRGEAQPEQLGGGSTCSSTPCHWQRFLSHSCGGVGPKPSWTLSLVGKVLRKEFERGKERDLRTWRTGLIWSCMRNDILLI